jgi:peptidyl-prolyl cis-trans isomerase SurA
MNQSAACRLALTSAVLLTAFGVVATAVSGPLAAQSSPRQAAAQPAPAKAEKQSQPSKAEQAIAVLVNDEPVTGYEIQQRAKFIALNANVSEQVKENFKRMVQAESTNKQVKAIYDDVMRKGGTKEEFEQRKTQFAMGLQKQALESARAGLIPKFKKEAQEELIEERLKLQEAKKIGIDITDDDVKRMMKSLADRNKMTEEQFAQHIKGLGVDISTMQERTRAQVAWREVVRRRFSAQISITNRDIDRLLSDSATESGEDKVELQVQKITLPMPAKPDQSAMAKRYAEAEGLRQKLDGCKSTADLAKDAGNARFEDMKYIKPSSIPEPTRSMLLSARDGEVLPPVTAAAGIEVYAVCGRRAVAADEKQREKAQEELAQKEFEIVAKRHLRDLRQDAHIEFR